MISSAGCGHCMPASMPARAVRCPWARGQAFLTYSASIRTVSARSHLPAYKRCWTTCERRGTPATLSGAAVPLAGQEWGRALKCGCDQALLQVCGLWQSGQQGGGRHQQGCAALGRERPSCCRPNGPACLLPPQLCAGRSCPPGRRVSAPEPGGAANTMALQLSPLRARQAAGEVLLLVLRAWAGAAPTGWPGGGACFRSRALHAGNSGLK